MCSFPIILHLAQFVKKARAKPDRKNPASQPASGILFYYTDQLGAESSGAADVQGNFLDPDPAEGAAIVTHDNLDIVLLDMK